MNISKTQMRNIGIFIDWKNETIIFTEKFLLDAGVVNSFAYEQMITVKKDLPNFTEKLFYEK